MTANDGNERLQPPADAGLDPAARRARLQGWAVLPGVLRLAECSVLAGLYGDVGGFRSRIVTARYSFGRGEYQ